MPIPASCTCGRRFMAKDHLAGKTVACPSCGTAFLVPTSGTRAAADPTASGSAATARAAKPAAPAPAAPASAAPASSDYSSPYDLLAGEQTNPLYAQAPATSNYQFADDEAETVGPRRSSNFAPIMIFGALTIGVVVGMLTLIGYFVSGLWGDGDRPVADASPSNNRPAYQSPYRPSTPPRPAYTPPPTPNIPTPNIPTPNITTPDPLANFGAPSRPEMESPIGQGVTTPSNPAIPDPFSPPATPTPTPGRFGPGGSGFGTPRTPSIPQPRFGPSGGQGPTTEAERKALYQYAKMRLRITDGMDRHIQRMRETNAPSSMVDRMVKQKQQMLTTTRESICRTRNVSDSELSQILAEGERQGW